MVELLLKSLISSGPIGVVLAVMIWDNIQMKKKLFEVIENNTKTVQKLVDTNIQVISGQKDIKKKLENLKGSQGESQP